MSVSPNGHQRHEGPCYGCGAPADSGPLINAAGWGPGCYVGTGPRTVIVLHPACAAALAQRLLADVALAAEPGARSNR